MSTTTSTATSAPGDDLVRLPRRVIDKILIGFGIIATLVFVIAGGLLLWGGNFSNNYVTDELTSQRIFFPTQEALEKEGRSDLVAHAGQQVTTGSQAEAYASYINGHLQKTADGKTYAEIDDRGAAAAVTAAKAANESPEKIAELEATAAKLKGQRDTLFKGETLRALLLSTFAWSTIGQIAGIASWVAFAAAVLLAALTIAGIVHLQRTTHA